MVLYVAVSGEDKIKCYPCGDPSSVSEADPKRPETGGFVAFPVATPGGTENRQTATPGPGLLRSAACSSPRTGSTRAHLQQRRAKVMSVMEIEPVKDVILVTAAWAAMYYLFMQMGPAP